MWRWNQAVRGVEKASYAASGSLCIAQPKRWTLKPTTASLGLLTLCHINSNHHPCLSPAPSHAPVVSLHALQCRNMAQILEIPCADLCIAKVVIDLWNHSFLSHYRHAPEPKPQSLRVLCTLSRGEELFISRLATSVVAPLVQAYNGRRETRQNRLYRAMAVPDALACLRARANAAAEEYRLSEPIVSRLCRQYNRGTSLLLENADTRTE